MQHSGAIHVLIGNNTLSSVAKIKSIILRDLMGNQLPFSASNASSLLTTSRRDPSTKSLPEEAAHTLNPSTIYKFAFSPYSPRIPASQPSHGCSHVIIRNFHLRDPEAEPLSTSSNTRNPLLPPVIIILIHSRDSVPDLTITHISHQIPRFRKLAFPSAFCDFAG